MLEDLTETLYTENIILVSADYVLDDTRMIMKYLSSKNKRTTVVFDEDDLIQMTYKIKAIPAVFYCIGMKSSNFLSKVCLTFTQINSKFLLDLFNYESNISTSLDC